MDMLPDFLVDFFSSKFFGTFVAIFNLWTLIILSKDIKKIGEKIWKRK